MNQQIAKLNYLHITPRKVRLIANTLKGLSVSEAEAQLILRPQRAARPLLKLLRSAAANAKVKKMDSERLYISGIKVDEGPMLKRMLPRAMGRGTSIHKKMSHVTIMLSENLKQSAPRFTITPPPKKEKKEKKKSKIQPKAEPKETKKEAVKETKTGFFKRIFRRKSV